MWRKVDYGDGLWKERKAQKKTKMSKKQKMGMAANTNGLLVRSAQTAARVGGERIYR